MKVCFINYIQKCTLVSNNNNNWIESVNKNIVFNSIVTYFPRCLPTCSLLVLKSNTDGVATRSATWSGRHMVLVCFLPPHNIINYWWSPTEMTLFVFLPQQYCTTTASLWRSLSKNTLCQSLYFASSPPWRLLTYIETRQIECAILCTVQVVLTCINWINKKNVLSNMKLCHSVPVSTSNALKSHCTCFDDVKTKIPAQRASLICNTPSNTWCVGTNVKANPNMIYLFINLFFFFGPKNEKNNDYRKYNKLLLLF